VHVRKDKRLDNELAQQAKLNNFEQAKEKDSLNLEPVFPQGAKKPEFLKK